MKKKRALAYIYKERLIEYAFDLDFFFPKFLFPPLLPTFAPNLPNFMNEIPIRAK